MVKLFDAQFFAGSALVIVAVAVAFAAVTRNELPIVGTGVGALLAVAAIGMAGCAVAGISQAPTLGWTNPWIVVGAVIGVVTLLTVAAGVFGWTAVLQPVGQFIPGTTASTPLVETAIIALAGLIVVKWGIGIAMAAFATS